MLSDVIKKITRTDQAARLERQESPQMIQKTKAVRFPSTIAIRIFEVQSEATGDGLYTCREEKLLSAEWADEAGDDKFAEKSTDEYTVLNLLEADPESEYVAHLTAGDLIKVWQMEDDGGTQRWVGTPLRDDRIRIAYCKDDAGAGSTIDCYLDKDTTGTVITVHCAISQGGGDLDDCGARLKDGDPMFVRRIFDGTNNYWWCVGMPYMPGLYCPCIP